MSAAITAPVDGSQQNVGKAFVFTGTGFANSTASTLHVSNPELGIDVTLKATSSGGGALAFSTAGTIVPQVAGKYVCTMSDGTSTVVATVEVFATG